MNLRNAVFVAGILLAWNRCWVTAPNHRVAISITMFVILVAQLVIWLVLRVKRERGEVELDLAVKEACDELDAIVAEIIPGLAPSYLTGREKKERDNLETKGMNAGQLLDWATKKALAEAVEKEKEAQMLAYLRSQ
jgi:hypothetical protein